MKRRYLRIVIAGVIFLLALLLTLYPVASNLYNQEHQSQIQTAYREVLEQTDTTELEHVRGMAVEYNKTIVPGTMGEAYTPNARIGMIQIIQTADIVYVQYLENIVNTHRAFHVRGFRIHHKAGRTSVTGREQEELAVTRMLHRIVLVG